MFPSTCALWFVWMCERSALPCTMSRSSGEWEKAIAVAEQHDRIHLKLTHHLYGRHLESVRMLSGAS